jgi:Na+-driven multidrug efflux pump
MGILGVSLSTIVSWVFYVILSLYYLRQKSATVRIRRENLRLDKQELVAILKIGVPTGLQMGMYAIANVVISAAVNAMGPEATTGISIANTYDGVLYNICVATSLAVMPYVSQNMGAHNAKRAVQSLWKGVWLTVCIGASFGALSALLSRPLAAFMSDDEMVIAFARQKMIIISSTYFICGINDIVGAALRGMGRSLSPTIATLVFMCILRFVWVYWIFPLLPNLTFLYFVWPIGWVLSIITLLFVLVPTVKMRKAEFAVE